MEVQPPLFVNVNGVIGPDELGLPFRDIFGEGTVSTGDLAVSAPGGMFVRVAAGAAWVKGDDNATQQPTYRVRNDANKDLAITAADPANPRKDIVIAEVLDALFSGASYSWRLRVVTGVPGAVPAEPALPNNALKLAVVTVPAATAAIVAGNIADARTPSLVGAGTAGVNSPSPTSQRIYDSGSIAAAAASIDSGVMSIPSWAKQLRWIFRGRSDQAGTSTANGPTIRLNGDTTASYRYAANADAGGVLQPAATGFNLGFGGEFANANSPANYWTHLTGILPLAFDTDVEKECQLHATGAYDATPNATGDWAIFGHWANTAAVNRLAVAALVGLLIAKSRLIIYAEA